MIPSRPTARRCADDDDTSPLSRAILSATDRKRAPHVYRPDSALTPLEQWEQHVADTLRLGLDRAQARTTQNEPIDSERAYSL